MNFKGGTSLSKGWALIDRFSEDIDLSIGRGFFLEKLNLHFALTENNTQMKNLRKASRDYIHGQLSNQLKNELEKLGVFGFNVKNHTEVQTSEGVKPISHDSDPTVIFVEYDSVLPLYNSDIRPRVKIEISCLSMDEPYEVLNISTMLHEHFKEIDNELELEIRTVTPSRTFLEKIFLLSEELQKDYPRFRRMSRHLYDLERIMDTEYGREALEDTELYQKIVSHRKKFYHLGYVDYAKNYPELITFLPSGEVLEKYRKDYEENMVDGYIYGNAIPFEELIHRLNELQNRIRLIKL